MTAKGKRRKQVIENLVNPENKPLRRRGIGREVLRTCNPKGRFIPRGRGKGYNPLICIKEHPKNI
jgi:hypothetical protein